VIDPYVQPNGVLRNRLNITEGAELATAEHRLALVRLYYLAEHPIAGQFDLAHLQSIHKYLFQDVYDWAGQTRTVDIGKGGTGFTPAAQIGPWADSVFSDLRREQNLENLTHDRFIERAAHHFAEVNVLHPFREGNGRAQCVFFSQLGTEAGWGIDWPQVTQQELDTASRTGVMSSTDLQAVLGRVTSPMNGPPPPAVIDRQTR